MIVSGHKYGMCNTICINSSLRLPKTFFWNLGVGLLAPSSHDELSCPCQCFQHKLVHDMNDNTCRRSNFSNAMCIHNVNPQVIGFGSYLVCHLFWLGQRTDILYV